MVSNLAIGLVGVGGRGGSFAAAIADHDHAWVHAVCDVDDEALAEAQDALGAEEAYGDYGTMLAESALDAVVIGTPMPLHAPQAIEALERDVHVLSEVPAAVSIEECRAIVEAAADSRATYAMAENYVYFRPNMLVAGLVREGLFGEPYYAEGEYLHELKALNEETPWRRTWQTGIDGVTYPTHSLGPILQWFPDDRVARVTCAGSGHHYTDPEGKAYEQQDTTVMLCETESGNLIRIRQDMLSERPHASSNYQLQGTTGCYESARAPEQRDRVWLAAFDDADASGEYEWRDLADFEEYLPEVWRDPPEAVQKAGHGGSDRLLAREYLDALLEDEPFRIGVHEAMDMTLPGLASQASIEDDGAWVDVPDSRSWV